MEMFISIPFFSVHPTLAATASTIGVLYVILALGYTDIALVLTFGHAVLRMVQILRAVNFPLETHHMLGAIEAEVEPKLAADFIYRLAWRLNRMNNGLVLPQILSIFGMSINSWELSKNRQYLVTFGLLFFAGMPMAPLTVFNDQVLMRMLHTHPYQAAVLMVLFVLSSSCLFWLVVANTLDPRRFRHSHQSTKFPSMESSKTASLLENDHLAKAVVAPAAKSAHIPSMGA